MRQSSTWNGDATAEQRLIMSGWLAGFMAHEVNNHLAAALLELELALGQAHSASTSELLARLHVAVESAGEVCRSTLGLLRPASDAGAPGRVGDAIERTLACLGRLRDRVVVEVPEECRFATTPLSLPRMQQVLLNAILNALQASQGKVFVAAQSNSTRLGPRSTWNKSEAKLETRTFETQSIDTLELSVEDNGAGMPAAIRTTIESGSASTQQLNSGGGFGLSILHRLVTDVGGSIRVETATPQGTRLTIQLPLVSLSKSRAA